MSGGAILNRNGSLALTRVRFEGNHATVRLCGFEFRLCGVDR